MTHTTSRRRPRRARGATSSRTTFPSGSRARSNRSSAGRRRSRASRTPAEPPLRHLDAFLGAHPCGAGRARGDWPRPAGEEGEGVHMYSKRRLGGLAAASAVVGTLLAVGAVATLGGSSSRGPAAAKATAAPALASFATTPTTANGWRERNRQGNVTLTGQVPLVVSDHVAPQLRHHAPQAELKVNFALPLRDKRSLDALIQL